jgi:hypothetical protein
MSNKYQDSEFQKKWGDEIASGGFVQIPNDLLRNLKILDLSANEAVILMIIMSYEEGSLISAQAISSDMGIHIKTVRNCFRKLDRQKKYMHRHFTHGGASRFTYGGIRTVILGIAKDRLEFKKYLHRGMVDIVLNHKQNLHTNKEENIEILKEDRGYKYFLDKGNEIKKRKSNEL